MYRTQDYVIDVARADVRCLYAAIPTERRATDALASTRQLTALMPEIDSRPTRTPHQIVHELDRRKRKVLLFLLSVWRIKVYIEAVGCLKCMSLSAPGCG